MKIRRRTLLAMSVMLVTVLALTACGSDGDSSTNTDSGSTESTTSTSSPTGPVTVKVARVGDLGTLLVDADGKTVYTLTKDGAAVACTGACLAAWPPVLLRAGADTATGGTGVSGLTAVDVAEGKQVASDGLPLFTFSGDAAAGDANGEGLASFGGVWAVVQVGGGSGASSGTSTTTDDGYDDGY